MVTVISRPIGHKLGTTEIDAVIADYAGDAVVYVPGGHSLSDGNYIFIESNFDAYNGFKYVDSIAYDHFKLKESEGGAYVPFKQEADIIFYVSELDHGFQSVHLPIVYELESDLFPNNTIEESYTNRVVSFAADSNGYTGIQASTDFININDLDYIEFIGDGDLAGIYQILEVIDNDEIVIDLAWDATNVFTGYELRKYYNNYFISVDVYGGLETGHRWADEKPFELLATLKLIPDSNNQIKFSINEILKGQIITRNNLTLDQLPNNIDFYTQFYIVYTEVYDVSDGLEITSVSQESVDDSIYFVGDAINSKYEFKSLNQSFASEYVNSDDTPARWLTTMDRPLAFVGYFFDISFINRYSLVDIIILRNGELFQTIVNPGSGILRIAFTPEDGFTEYCLQAFSAPLLQPTLPPLSAFIQDASGTDSWALGANPSYSASGTNDSNVLYAPYEIGANLNYEFDYDIDVTLTGGQAGDKILFGIYSGGMFTELYDLDLTSSGNYTGALEIITSAGASFFAIKIVGTPSSITVDINSIDSAIIDIGSKTITEQICIDIVSDCNTFINDDLRLTEGGVFRELE